MKKLIPHNNIKKEECIKIVENAKEIFCLSYEGILYQGKWMNIGDTSNVAVSYEKFDDDGRMAHIKVPLPIGSAIFICSMYELENIPIEGFIIKSPKLEGEEK